jgi:hypothetical protein
MGLELILTRSKKNPILCPSDPIVYMNLSIYRGEYIRHDKNMLTCIASKSRRG